MCRGLSLHYGKQLELSTYQHNTADYIYMYLVGMMSMNVRFLSPPSVSLPLGVRTFICLLQCTPVLLILYQTWSAQQYQVLCIYLSATVGYWYFITMDCHSRQHGLTGYLILFAPHAFARQCPVQS